MTSKTKTMPSWQFLDITQGIQGIQGRGKMKTSHHRVYLRIALAVKNGKGMRLSADNCRFLLEDHAISEAAFCEAVEVGMCTDCLRHRCRCEEVE